MLSRSESDDPEIKHLEDEDMTKQETDKQATNGEPRVMFGANEGATSVEYLLHALDGCVTTSSRSRWTSRLAAAVVQAQVRR